MIVTSDDWLQKEESQGLGVAVERASPGGDALKMYESAFAVDLIKGE